MELFAGVDLHSNNGYYGIVDKDGERVFQKKILNSLPIVLSALRPFRGKIRGIAVESTYNWYWLVDGLMENGYPVHLANPAGIQPYNGLKNANDKSDAFFLTELLRLGILPEGHIYPKEERPVRDLLRRRMMLVQQRTSHILSFQGLLSRQTGAGMSSNAIKSLKEEEVQTFLDEECLVLTGETNISAIRFLTEKIRRLEKAALKRVKLKPEYEKLLTAPGIGKILALTIMLETGPIGRFRSAGNYASYCRAVKAKRTSNEKKKGKGNQKNGNRYLGWAYVEAANFARRYCPEAKRYFQRKMARTNAIVATKALASKISKACYSIMRNQVDFDVKKMFG
jgi:transposase